jgi:hypothetical protein
MPEITGGGDREGSAIGLEIAKEWVELTTATGAKEDIPRC